MLIATARTSLTNSPASDAASQHIPDTVKSDFPGVQWGSISGLRNLLAEGAIQTQTGRSD